MHRVVITDGTYTKTGNVFGWFCETCQESCDGHLSSKAAKIQALAHEIEVPLSHIPTHTVDFSVDDLGATVWVCSCGESSRVGGHVEPRRAKASAGVHISSRQYAWLENRKEYLMMAEDKKKARAYDIRQQVRLHQHHLKTASPEAREKLIQRDLDEIL